MLTGRFTGSRSVARRRRTGRRQAAVPDDYDTEDDRIGNGHRRHPGADGPNSTAPWTVSSPAAATGTPPEVARTPRDRDGFRPLGAGDATGKSGKTSHAPSWRGTSPPPLPTATTYRPVRRSGRGSEYPVASDLVQHIEQLFQRHDRRRRRRRSGSRPAAFGACRAGGAGGVPAGAIASPESEAGRLNSRGDALGAVAWTRGRGCLACASLTRSDSLRRRAAGRHRPQAGRRKTSVPAAARAAGRLLRPVTARFLKLDVEGMEARMEADVLRGAERLIWRWGLITVHGGTQPPLVCAGQYMSMSKKRAVTISDFGMTTRKLRSADGCER